MAELSHTSIGKYEIIKRLAAGGMGEIFLARQTGIASFERLVIIKTMLPSLAGDDRTLDQFFDEARVAATLNHPNVVSIYELGRHEEIYFIAMEYIHGVDLFGLTKLARSAGVQLPPRIAAAIVRAAAVGLEYAHNAVDINGAPMNIVHRDVSPQNIMVRLDGGVKVVDFGIAHAANRFSKTEDNSIKGKLLYMAPEQIRGEALTARSDQFSLGALAWELFALKRLFWADNPGAIMMKITRDAVTPLAEARADIPRDLDLVITRMLQRAPAERFERCADVANALQAYLDLTGGSADNEVAAFVEELAGADIAARADRILPTSEQTSEQQALDKTLVACSRCQSWHEPNAKFCNKCGAPIGAPVSADLSAVAPALSAEERLPGLDLIEISRTYSGDELRRASATAPDGTPLAQTQAGAMVVMEGGQTYIEFDDPIESQVLELADEGVGARVGPAELLFQGRAAELDQLRGALDQAREGRASGRLVVGEEGAGKSRLLLQLVAPASERGFRTAYAISLRRGVALALDLFRQWVLALNDGFADKRQRSSAEASTTVADSFVGVSEELVPGGLQRRLVQLFDAEDHELLGDVLEHGQRQVAALMYYFMWITRAAPICLLADDLQYADRVSADLLSLLLERLPRSRLCVVGTTSPARVDVVKRGFERLSLGPMSAVELRCAAQSVTSFGNLPPETDALIDQLGGNPTIVVQQLRRLIVEGQSVSSVGAAQRFTSAAACAEWLCDRLTPESLEVLQIAAVAGELFPVELLELAKDGDADAVRIALHDGMQLGLVSPVGRGDPKMRFTQSSFRRSLLAGVDPDEVPRLRSLLTSSLQMSASVPPHEIGEAVVLHAFAAGQPDAEAIHLAAQRAPALITQGLIFPALDLLNRGLEAGRKLLAAGHRSDQDLSALLLRLAGPLCSCLQRIDPERGSSLTLELLAKLPAEHTPSLRAHVMWRLSLCLRALGRDQQAATAIEQALRLLDRDPDPVLQATLEAEKGVLLGERGQAGEGVFLLSEALDTLGRSPMREGEGLLERCERLGDLYRHLTGLYVKMGHPELAHQAALRAREISRYSAQAHDEVRALLLLAKTAPDRPALGGFLGEAASVAEGLADPWLMAEAYLAQAHEALAAGEKTASPLLQQARQAATLAAHREVLTALSRFDRDGLT